MPLFPQSALNPGVRKREVFGWAMYDFANSGYTTVVLTAVFNAYFVGVIAKGADWATLAIVVSNTFYSYGESLTAAFLPDLARRDAMGTVSGWAGASATSAACSRWA